MYFSNNRYHSIPNLTNYLRLSLNEKKSLKTEQSNFLPGHNTLCFVHPDLFAIIYKPLTMSHSSKTFLLSMDDDVTTYSYMNKVYKNFMTVQCQVFYIFFIGVKDLLIGSADFGIEAQNIQEVVTVTVSEEAVEEVEEDGCGSEPSVKNSKLADNEVKTFYDGSLNSFIDKKPFSQAISQILVNTFLAVKYSLIF